MPAGDGKRSASLPCDMPLPPLHTCIQSGGHTEWGFSSLPVSSPKNGQSQAKEEVRNAKAPDGSLLLIENTKETEQGSSSQHASKSLMHMKRSKEQVGYDNGNCRRRVIRQDSFKAALGCASGEKLLQHDRQRIQISCQRNRAPVEKWFVRADDSRWYGFKRRS